MITAYKHIRILMSLLKQNNIRHCVLSPGSRNMSIVKSLEDDPFFQCYSVVDERSAAYFAVGLSLEVKSPVVISCTSAQATRNYMPGLTEAYYRKAPILAITADYDNSLTDQLNMQSIRQMSIPSDAANVSLDIPLIKDINDEYLVNRNINEAIDALTRNGGGPSHLNIRINQHWITGDDVLEKARRIIRYLPEGLNWPEIGQKKVLLLIGQHQPFSDNEKFAIENFARKYDTVIYVNHISNFNGHKSLHANRLLFVSDFTDLKPDLLITIGGHLGDYPIDGKLKNSSVEHWRVCVDGKYSDTYNSLTKIFECSEEFFFQRMARLQMNVVGDKYFQLWKEHLSKVEVPQDYVLSHALIASKLAPRLPKNSLLHLAILSSMRNWELFDIDPSIRCYSNVAGFGIDGCMSTFLGQSVANQELSFLIIGDLSFFYDMNSIGIRHLKNNVRIVLINNRGGGEFRLYSNTADSFGENSNRHIAAAGHFGKSAEGWVRNNNFDYIPVENKKQLDDAIERFVKPSDKSILMEVFTTMKDDSDSLEFIYNLNHKESQKDKLKKIIKENIPDDLKTSIRKIFKR